MRQLQDGKVENFPSPEELKCAMVEHSLQGESASMSVLDFVASGMDRPEVVKSRGPDHLTFR